ncbi:MAG: hypothetical protein VX589_19800 [Myxococcota bacterium]|nr:hypothetical protein [Myxococcota bacterium]
MKMVRLGWLVSLVVLAMGCGSSDGSENSAAMGGTPATAPAPAPTGAPAMTGTTGPMGTTNTNMPGTTANTPAAADTTPPGAGSTNTDAMPSDTPDNANNNTTTMPVEPCPAGQERVDGVCQTVDPPMDGMAGSDVAGDYILQTKVTTIQTTPIGDQTSVTTLNGYLNIAPDGAGGWTSTEYGCGGGSSTDGGVTITISQSLSETIPERVMPFRVFSAGGMNRFARSEAAVAIGIMLANPLQESLPMNTMDPRIFDQDMDGQPGITVDVTVEGALASLLGSADHKIYVMQINRNAMSGTIGADGSLTGALVDRSEQRILGASTMLLEMDLPARPDPNASNTFRAFKVDNAAIDCTWVNANKGTYFP